MQSRQETEQYITKLTFFHKNYHIFPHKKLGFFPSFTWQRGLVRFVVVVVVVRIFYSLDIKGLQQ
jgi:hypothetical protein